MSFVDSHVIMDATCHDCRSATGWAWVFWGRGQRGGMGTTVEDYYNGYPWWTSSYFTGSLADFGALGHRKKSSAHIEDVLAKNV